MANSNGWGDGAANNTIGWGQGANNNIGWGDSHAKSWAGLTDIVGIDADAQAFITAAAITDPVQINAINTLVEGMKTDGIWTKMKAIYPFVGGTATTHKWNLKDPRDLDAAFRLVFNGGWTHSSTGATPNGINSYGDTKLLPSSVLSLNSAHVSFYSRTNNNTQGYDIGAALSNSAIEIVTKWSDNLAYYSINKTEESIANTDSRGYFIASRTASNSTVLYKNSSVLTSSSLSSQTLPTCNIFISAMNLGGTPTISSTKQCAFSTIGDGLTDTEAANLYTRVQAFNQALSRQVGVPIVSDADAQAFLNSAEITDITQANAINTLVTDLKAQGLWTKMKAIYPFVGGTASTHKYNLKDPRDLDAAYRLVFNGGWTHSSTGALPNGTNGYADTKLNTNLFTNNSAHLSYYSRTNSAISSEIVMGNLNDLTGSSGLNLVVRRNTNLNSFRSTENIGASGLVDSTSLDARGLTIGSMTSAASRKLYKNLSLLNTNTSNITWDRANANLYIGASLAFNTGLAGSFTDKQTAFASLGDGLNDTEATALYNAVNTYQVALSRNV